MRALLVALPNEVLLDMVVGAALTVMAYSSLAIVLLTATLAASGMVPVGVALGLVLGANLGSGMLGDDRHRARLAAGAAAADGQSAVQGRRRADRHAAAAARHVLLQEHVDGVHQQVVLFHLGFNLALALLFIGLTGGVARIATGLLPARRRGRAPSGRATSTRPRWPRRRWPSPALRARRCTRPTWSRPCCAASCR